MTSFKADESYVPPNNIKKRYHVPVALSLGSYKEMFTQPSMRLAFFASVASFILVNAAIIALSDIHHHVIILSLISLLCFIWVQKQFITISRGLNFKQSYNQVFKEKMPDGWYDDPWAFGSVGQMRFFHQGVWTENIKLSDSVAQLVAD